MVIVTALVTSGIVGVGSVLVLYVGFRKNYNVPLLHASEETLAHAPRNQTYHIRSIALEIIIKDESERTILRLERLNRRPSSGDGTNELWRNHWKAFSVVENKWIASISLAKLGKSGRIEWLGETPDGLMQNNNSISTGNRWLHKWHGWTKLKSQLLFRRFSNEMESDKLVADPTISLFVAARIKGDIYEVELPRDGGLIQAHGNKFLLWKHPTDARIAKNKENISFTIAEILAQGKSGYDITIDVSLIDISTALLISVIANFRSCK